MASHLSPSRQVAFHQLLVGARKTWLTDALRATLAVVDADEIKKQLAPLVPSDVGRLLSQAGIRDEYVFPAPLLLEARPTLVGYYRLLLGMSQKAFYRSGGGMGAFKTMEVNGTINQRQRDRLPSFCAEMSAALADLVRQISPAIANQDVRELPILTLGSQLQGASNVEIGKKATLEVFLAISEIVEAQIEERTQSVIVVRNASGRRVRIALSGDPDVRIEEEFESAYRNKVAVEIKGGTDFSNVHNRAGEAEKSHRKAKNEDFRDFWTIILLKGVDASKLHAESPTTTSWFDAAQVLGRSGSDWEAFRSRIAEVVGIPTRAE
jgi:hypothetical protein